MQISERGFAFVAAREACVLSAYPDSRMLAIGFGQNDRTLKPGDTINLDQAIALFLTEGKKIEDFLRRAFPDDLQQQHADALFSLAYNVGVTTIWENTELRSAVATFRAAPTDKSLRDLAALEIIKTHPRDKSPPFNLSRRCREALVFIAADYGDLSTMQLWPAGKSPKNTPPDAPSIVSMPTFLRG